MTEKIYKENVYEKKSEAVITAVSEYENYTILTMDRTIFFPTGGGQSCDTGTINKFIVSDVFEKDNEIYHRIDETGTGLKPGNNVLMQLDWEHRFDNMQRHCGEHILSGMFYEYYGGVNRGFHMGDNYMTIDISLEDKPEYTDLTWEMAAEVELAANKAVWSNLPVITRHFDTREEAEGLPLRKKLAFDEDITIVCVGSVDNPADCVACCGTHPATSGQVGIIKLYKVEKNKGMFRVYFEAGQRAFRQYQERFDILATLENRLSAGYEDILHKYEASQEKNKEVRNQLYRLKKSLIADETKSIITQLSEPFFTKYYDNLTIDDILTIGRGLIEKISGILFLVHRESNTVLLFSKGEGRFDCGKLVKENASIYHGKGGGNKNSARAIFDKSEYVDTFIDLIEKHLR